MSDIKNAGTLPRLVYSVSETAQILGGISTKSVYRLLARGFLKSTSALRHKLITAESIQQFINTTAK